MKSQEKPGIIREFSIIFVQIREKLGKTKIVQVHMLFSSTLSMDVGKVVAPFVTNNCELHHFA